MILLARIRSLVPSNHPILLIPRLLHIRLILRELATLHIRFAHPVNGGTRPGNHALLPLLLVAPVITGIRQAICVSQIALLPIPRPHPVHLTNGGIIQQAVVNQVRQLILRIRHIPRIAVIAEITSAVQVKPQPVVLRIVGVEGGQLTRHIQQRRHQPILRRRRVRLINIGTVVFA